MSQQAQMMTPKEVSETLKVTIRTVYNWINSLRLPAAKIGGAVRVSEDDLRDFLDRCRKR